jgi:hypothetical protein
MRRIGPEGLGGTLACHRICNEFGAIRDYGIFTVLPELRARSEANDMGQ